MSTKRFELNSTAFDYITPQVCSRSSAIKQRRAARRLLHKSVGLAFYFTSQSGRSSKRGFAPIVFLKHRQIMAMKTLAICLFFHCSLGYSLRLRSCRSVSHFTVASSRDQRSGSLKKNRSAFLQYQMSSNYYLLWKSSSSSQICSSTG